MSSDYSNMSMLDLFRMEAEGQLTCLSEGLLALEKTPLDATLLESLMRASHSLKGAARMVGIDAIVDISHVMEDVFVAAQHGKLELTQLGIDILLRATDTIEQISLLDEAQLQSWVTENAAQLGSLVEDLGRVHSGRLAELDECAGGTEGAGSDADDGGTTEVLESAIDAPAPDAKPAVSEIPARTEKRLKTAASPQESNAARHRDPVSATAADDRVLRVNAEKMSRIQGVSGEILVESRRLSVFSDSLMQLKQRQNELMERLESLLYRDEILTTEMVDDGLRGAQQKLNECRQILGQQLSSLDEYDRRNSNLSNRLYHEVTGSRMQPFSAGTTGLGRMVRDLSRSLGKNVELTIKGEDTPVDRDVLEKIKAPLNHLLRNSMDHGIESPEQRREAGKPEQAVIVVAASHGGGMLRVSIRDDGAGIDTERLKQKIIEKGLTTEDVVKSLGQDELIEFLFLPDFSTRDSVTETSGRGVGLDVVHEMMKELGGTVSVENHPGQGAKFILNLPLSLSVLTALLVDIAGEPYAFPLSRVDRVLSISSEDVQVMEGRQYFELDGELVGLAVGAQVLGLDKSAASGDEVSVVVVSDRLSRYGVVVDRFIGQRQLSVQSLDPRLGKVQDISSTALMEDGSPLLIMDVDDLVNSIVNIVEGGRLSSVLYENQRQAGPRAKRVLIVEDSLTVREVERNLLEAYGYIVDTAVDGMDGWNTIRNSAQSGGYHLVISDVDMPRMDGIELVNHIKEDARLSEVPVMIVSYKDRAEDRRRGLEAGADYYLAKGSIHDDTLINAVVDLIGEASL